MKSREMTKFRKTYVEYAGVYGKDGLALAVLFDEKIPSNRWVVNGILHLKAKKAAIGLWVNPN